MQTCKYALKRNPSKTVDAKYIGYWSIRWAADQAPSALRAFQRPPLADFPIIRAAAGEQSFHTSLVVIALHAAAYWVVAAGIPAVTGRIDQPTYRRTLEQLRLGRDDSLKELLLPSGQVLPKSTAKQVASLIERFHDDVLNDLYAAAQEPGSSRAGATFAAVLQANFKLDFPTEQQSAFGGFVDEAARKLIEHVQETLEVRV